MKYLNLMNIEDNNDLNIKIENEEENGIWVEDECGVIWNDELYIYGNGVGGIDEFLDGKDLSNLVMLRGDGYRGECNYSGIYVDGDNVYVLDFMNEYGVWKLNKKV